MEPINDIRAATGASIQSLLTSDPTTPSSVQDMAPPNSGSQLLQYTLGPAAVGAITFLIKVPAGPWLLLGRG